MENLNLSLGLVWYVCFLFSTVFHEASHAFFSYKLGDKTAYLGGQVSLDPLPHIRREPFGMVIVPLLTFMTSGWVMGWASTPYDPFWARYYPRRAGLMSVAGPLANLTLFLIALILIKVGIVLNIFLPSPYPEFTKIVLSATGGIGESLALFLSVFFSLNLILFLFNLLPIPPLDGASALGLFLPKKAASTLHDWMNKPMVGLIGILLAWKFFRFIFWPVWDWVTVHLL